MAGVKREEESRLRDDGGRESLGEGGWNRRLKAERARKREGVRLLEWRKELREGEDSVLS